MRLLAMRHYEKGATSLFIVLFSTLLFTVITVGFIGLMTSDQRRATDSEWSEGAYDSALAGVEDGKRVLALCRDKPGDRECDAIDAKQCDTISAAGLVADTDGEVLIQSSTAGGSTSSNSVNQAYTCVIINRDTPDYKGKLKRDESALIALNTGSRAFNQMTISWFTKDDVNAGQQASFGTGGALSLPRLSGWSTDATRPPIMRAQFMQYERGEAIDLADFDKDGYAHTAFLYPRDDFGPDNSVSLETQDKRYPGILDDASTKKSPLSTKCSRTIPSNGYACSITLEVPGMSNRQALLHLTALYEGATYKIQLKNSSDSIVNFVNTQPSIDSNGRAGDVFRRVEARIDMDGAASAPYPRATIDVTESLCKNLRIGAENSSWSACSP